MPTGALTGYIDIAQVSLYIFWLFFAGLIYYIRREDRREGYPLETDLTGKTMGWNSLLMAKPKTYRLPHGGTYQAPNDKRDTRPIPAERAAPWPGAHYVPTGDPMNQCVGPAAWAERHTTPELSREGEPLVVPMRVATDYKIAKQSRDPRGLDVIAGDDVTVGKVVDLWVDRGDQLLRYYEVEIEGGAHVLVPVPMLRVQGDPRHVRVVSIMSEHFPRVPRLENPDQITVMEEEVISSFYAGGRLYARPERQEPLV